MKKIKMPNAFVTLFILMAIMAVLTWIIPAGAYDYVDPEASKLQPIAGTYHRVEQNGQGLWEALNSPIQGVYDTIDIILFVFVMGGFLKIVYKTGAINAGIGSVIRKMNGKESLMIPFLMFIFGLGGTIFGMSEETIPFYLIIIPIFVAAGYDALTGCMVVFAGTHIGNMASTTNPFSVGIASGFANVSIGDGLLLRVILFIVLELVGAWYITLYAKKVKADPTKSLLHGTETSSEFEGVDFKEYTAITHKQKVVLILFALSFVIMIMGVIPWEGSFNVLAFDNFVNTLSNVPVLGSVLGGVVSFGNWWFQEMTLVFLISAVIIAKYCKMDNDELLATFIEGAKELMEVGLVIGVSRSITIIMDAGGITATILNLGENTLAKMGSIPFLICLFLIYLPLAFLVPSTSALATLTMPIFAPLAGFAGVRPELVVVCYVAASGAVNLLTPTSGVLMGSLAMAKVPYNKFWQFSWKMVALLSVIVLVILSLVSVLG